jgi:uncharacterized membrane protein
MDLTAFPLPAAFAIASWLVAAIVVARALLVAPWRRFGASEPVHVWYGGIFFVVALWSLQASLDGRFTFHLLGVVALALTAGFAHALVGAMVAVVLLIAIKGALWMNAGVAYLTMAAVPIAMTWLVLRFAERRLPPNFFVYVFVVAFFGAALAFLVGGLAAAIALVAPGGVPASIVFGDYAPYLLYLAFGEATLTGMLLTLAVVYRPQWVTTFDDERYVRGR